ncbi:YdcF family protein [Candidatus Saccharibacteria bacterium]|nr:YdcF family protein [Candidatus Saccharibacteria bacterium]
MKRHLIRWLIGCVVIIVGIIVLTFGLSFYLSPDDLKNCLPNSCQPVDAIVVISGGDTTARVNEAVKLQKLGLAKQLIVSGAAADKQGPSNALVMKEEAVAAGVPADLIFMDEFSNNTNENAMHTKEIVENHDIKSIILVTSAYHQRRAYLEFSKALGTGVQIYNHPVATDSGWEKVWWLTPRGWWLAISEVVKIVMFYGQQL